VKSEVDHLRKRISKRNSGGLFNVDEQGGVRKQKPSSSIHENMTQGKKKPSHGNLWAAKSLNYRSRLTRAIGKGKKEVGAFAECFTTTKQS